jgi:hypothetical protein
LFVVRVPVRELSVGSELCESALAAMRISACLARSPPRHASSSRIPCRGQGISFPLRHVPSQGQRMRTSTGNSDPCGTISARVKPNATAR